MLFLLSWKIWEWPKEVAKEVQEAALRALRTVFYAICSLIYRLVAYLYDVFELLCHGRILDNTVLNQLSKRVGLILGLIMLFFVVFSFIKMLVDPDLITDKSKGAVNVIKKTLLVIVMLGVSNYFFETLYSIQKTVVDSHVVSKLLLPYTVNTDKFGGVLSSQVFLSFYTPAAALDSVKVDNGLTFGDVLAGAVGGLLGAAGGPEGFALGAGSAIALKRLAFPNAKQEEFDKCVEQLSVIDEEIISSGDYSGGETCLNISVEKSNGSKIFLMDFNFLLSTFVGLFMVYILGMYCIKIGIRMVQLAFLEIISPMAIISYLSPKQDNMFSKWSKMYFSTYIDVFIRIIIINFVVYLIALILGNGSSNVFWDSINSLSLSRQTKTFIMVVMILALLAFAKKVPDLLKDLFPAGASKLGFGGMKWNDMLGGNYIKGAAKIATAGSAIGLLGAASSGYSRYKINRKNGVSIPKSVLGGFGGVASAIPRGLKAGAAKGNIFSNVSKGWENQRSVDDKYDELITGGGSTVGKFTSHLSAHFGETKGQRYSRIITNNEKVSNSVKNLDDIAENFKDVKIARTSWENAKARGASDTELRSLYDAYKDTKDRMKTAALQGQNFADVKDQSVAESMKVSQSEIAAMIDSGQVVLNRADGSVIRGSDLTNSSSIDDVSIAASRNISSIKMQPDFSSALQNDKSAGVNSNGKK